MARNVRIATLGPPPLTMGPAQSPDALVARAIEHWRYWFEQVLPDVPDLIVVPELCDQYPDAPEPLVSAYRASGHKVMEFFAGVARGRRCYIVYPSIVQMPDGTRRNAGTVLDRDGCIAGQYYKNHLVIHENAQHGLLYGRRAPIINCDFGRLACAICFDLNFNELRMQYVLAKPDLIVFPSMYHGGLSQSIWAYTCRCHFVGAVSGLPCEIRNPFGQVLHSSTNYRPYVVGDVNLDCCMAHLDENWEKLRLLKARHGPNVTILDPGLFGVVLISSLADGIGAREMAAEFEIELLDDYLSRSLTHRHAPGHMEN